MKADGEAVSAPFSYDPNATLIALAERPPHRQAALKETR